MDSTVSITRIGYVGSAGLIRRGQWTKVPTIIGGQSCESCYSALGAFGVPNPDKPISKAEFDAALIKSGFDGVQRLPSGAMMCVQCLGMLPSRRVLRPGRALTF